MTTSHSRSYSIHDLAKEVNLAKVRCPHCGRRVQTLRLLDDLFSAVLIHLIDGFRVHVRGFGSFGLVATKARVLKTPLFKDKAVEGARYISFTAAARAKRVVNGKEGV